MNKQRADAETKEKEKIQCQKEAIKKATNRNTRNLFGAQTSEADHAKLLAETIERSAKLHINLKTECAKQIMNIQAENTRVKDSAETSEAEKERVRVKFVEVSEQNHQLQELTLKHQELEKCNADLLNITSRKCWCCIKNCWRPELPGMLWQSMLRWSLAHARCWSRSSTGDGGRLPREREANVRR